ncbi:MAG: GDP-mannose 4,6-dehydratase [Candidatus Velthaea sp.]
MRVLVTGANGFVGRHLVAALEARGHDVVRSGHGVYDERTLPLDLHDPLNIRGVIDVARPDAIAHLAAQSFVPASIDDPLETFAVNATGTLHLLEAVRAARAAGAPNPRVVVAGSADVYGAHPAQDYPLKESAVLQPANPYAASKVAAEALAIAAARSYGLDTVVTRAFNHIGPGQDERFAVASFALQLARIAAGGGPLLLVGNLDAQRDFLDVRDVVAAYVALLEGSGDSGEVYNIASGQATTMKEILRKLVTIARVGVEIRDDPARMRPSDIPITLGDATKLRERAGWAPSHSLPASLRDIYADACERVAAAS